MKGVVLILLLAWAQDPKQGEDAIQRVSRIQKAIEWLESSDAGVCETARAQLREFGREAIPYLERRLAEKGTAELAKALRELDPAGDSRWVDPADLPGPGGLPKDLPKLTKQETDKYVHVRYLEALAQCNRKNYQAGYDIAKALLDLEPFSADADALKKLKRRCENMIVQTTIVEAKIVQEKLFYVEGEQVDLTLRLQNRHKNGIKIDFGKGKDGPMVGVAILEVEVSARQLEGGILSGSMPQDVRFGGGEIPIATGAQWEHKFTLDTTVDLQDADQVRVFTVNAWTLPEKIDAGGQIVTRRIQFEPAIVKVVPKKYAAFLENPVEWLGKLIGTGTAQEIYVCAQLLPDDQKELGFDFLIRAMEKTEDRRFRHAMGWALYQIYPKKWADWQKNKGSKAK